MTIASSAIARSRYLTAHVLSCVDDSRALGVQTANREPRTANKATSVQPIVAVTIAESDEPHDEN
jgi:hypothetical protein